MPLMMRTTLLVFLIICIPLCSHAQESKAQKEWDLDTCERIALERSPLIHAARHGLSALQQKYTAAAWAWFPTFKLSAAATLIPPQGEGDPAAGDPDLSGFNFWSKTELEMYAPIYTFGKIAALKRMAKSGVRIGESAVRLAEEEVIFQVHRAWYGIQLAAELEDVVLDAESLLKKARNRIEALEEEDSDDFDQNDVFRLRIHEAEIQDDTLKNQRLGALSAAGLRVAMGLTRRDPIQIPEKPGQLLPVELNTKTLEETVELAALKRPELRAAQYRVALRQANVDRKFAEFFPNIFVVGTFSIARSTVDQEDTVFSKVSFNATGGAAAVGMELTLDYPIKVANWRGAKADLAKAESQLRAANDILGLEVEKAWREVQDQKRLHEVNRRAVRAARSLLVSHVQTYEDGIDEDVGLDTILRAATTYLKRKAEWLRSVYAFNLGVAQLSRVIGTPMAHNVDTSETGDSQ